MQISLSNAFLSSLTSCFVQASTRGVVSQCDSNRGDFLERVLGATSNLWRHSRAEIRAQLHVSQRAQSSLWRLRQTQWSVLFCLFAALEIECSTGKAQAFNDLFELAAQGDQGYSWRPVSISNGTAPAPRARHVAVTVLANY